MENLNTNSTENYSQLETRILQAIPLMTPENQRILLQAVEAMVATTPKIDTEGELKDVRAILDVLLHFPEMTAEPDTQQVLAGICFDKIQAIMGAQP